MDKDTIAELEILLFDMVEEPGISANMMADTIGVLINLKPAMIGAFSKKGFKSSDVDKFETILDKLCLERVYYDQYIFVSKKLKTAERTRRSFVELWSVIDEGGRILNKKKWANVTKKIGKLLGYPKTAIKNFIKENDTEDETRMKRMERNRYYAHSAEYEDEEFKIYDQILNSAISNLAPKTANFLSSNKKKRWLD